MKRIILYFSATGNSLYVANELKGDGGEALSIPQLMKSGATNCEAKETGTDAEGWINDAVGFWQKQSGTTGIG